MRIPTRLPTVSWHPAPGTDQFTVQLLAREHAYPMTKSHVLFVFPTAWDRKQLDSCRPEWEDRFQVTLAHPTDEDCPWDYDIMGFIERTAAEFRDRIQGVMSSSDYPGATVAGAIAQRLGLPGSAPDRVIRASHKYYSRIVQRETVPEATPDFELVDPRQQSFALRSLGYPCFIKPVKGAFSVMSRRLNSPADLTAFFARPAVSEFATDYVRLFNQLVKGLTQFEIDGSYFLAEGLLRGRQATVEGFVCAGEVEIVGIVDSVIHAETGSFVRFDYPSTLTDRVQRRMGAIARRAIAGLGLADTFFNIELTYEERSDSIGIIEINPRICGQFADLYQKVDGRSTYALALELAVGDKPRAPRREGAFQTASSHPLRVFRPTRVVRAPDHGTIRRVEAEVPGTLVWSECEAGQLVQDFETLEDGQSYRYAIVNLGGASDTDLLRRLDDVLGRLQFQLEPI